MADLKQCEFFLLRYVPDAVKDEFVNIGVVLVEPGANGAGFSEVKFTRDWQRVKCLDPAADLEMLEGLADDLRARLKEGREDFLHRIEESFSNLLQITPAKACLTESPAEELGRLAEMYLERVRRPASKGAAVGRQAIVQRMREAFEQAGVWELMTPRIPVWKYTHPGDPLKIDCGYRPYGNGELKMFHAVALASDVDAAKVLAFTYPQIREGIARLEQAKTSLTAIVEDDLDRADEPIAFALDTLARNQIAVRPQAELPDLAETARRELRV